MVPVWAYSVARFWAAALWTAARANLDNVGWTLHDHRMGASLVGFGAALEPLGGSGLSPSAAVSLLSSAASLLLLRPLFRCCCRPPLRCCCLLLSAAASLLLLRPFGSPSRFWPFCFPFASRIRCAKYSLLGTGGPMTHKSD